MYTVSDVDDSTFLAAAEFLRSAVRSSYPNFDLGPGSAFNDLVITPLAKTTAAGELNNKDFLAGFTGDDLDIEATDIIDLIAARYFVDRKSGAVATGVVTIVTSSNSSLVIPTSASFVTDDGLTFNPSFQYRVFSEETLATSTNDLVFKDYGNGLYYVRISLSASESGAAYNIIQRTTFNVSGIRNLSEAYAATDFSGGKELETNEELIARLPTEYSAKSFGSTRSIEAMVTEAFPNVDISIAGKSSEVMLRDTRNALGLHSGGVSDIYVRSQVRPSFDEQLMEAKLIDVNNSIYEITVLSDEYPGLYSVSKVRSVNIDGNLPILTRTPFFTESDSPLVNNIVDAFGSTRYSIKFTFKDVNQNSVGLALGSTRKFLVTIFSMPLIDSITEFVEDPDNKNVALDLLVRGVTPAVVSAVYTIEVGDGDATPDVDQIKLDTITTIKEFGIGKSVIDSSIFIGAATANIGSHSFVDTSTLTLGCTIFASDGSVSNISNSKTIRITDHPEKGIHPDSIGFLVNEDSITINVVQN